MPVRSLAIGKAILIEAWTGPRTPAGSCQRCQPYTPATFALRRYPWQSFLLEAESSAVEGFSKWIIPITPSGIEPANSRPPRTVSIHRVSCSTWVLNWSDFWIPHAHTWDTATVLWPIPHAHTWDTATVLWPISHAHTWDTVTVFWPIPHAHTWDTATVLWPISPRPRQTIDFQAKAVTSFNLVSGVPFHPTGRIMAQALVFCLSV
jgi:hypothetical protein